MISKPIAVTCGEPAGIGSELTVKAWNKLKTELIFFWMGDPGHLPKGTTYRLIESPNQAKTVMSTALPVLPVEFPEPVHFGYPNPRNAPKIVDVLLKAVELSQKDQINALCSMPINKQVLQDGADFHYPGHTEFLASISGAKRSVMMLVSPELKVVPATIHIPLSQVAPKLNAADLEEIIIITHKALRNYFQIDKPEIAIAGLNPHAGENGKIGHEEITLILPLIEKLQKQGLSVTGPHSADSMFHKTARERYDVAITMYHDQALIPIKTLHFDMGVNLTLGLNFVRTSPDHGTALDIAGHGTANPTSTIEAIRLANRLGKINGKF